MWRGAQEIGRFAGAGGSTNIGRKWAANLAGGGLAGRRREFLETRASGAAGSVWRWELGDYLVRILGVIMVFGRGRRRRGGRAGGRASGRAGECVG